MTECLAHFVDESLLQIELKNMRLYVQKQTRKDKFSQLLSIEPLKKLKLKSNKS